MMSASILLVGLSTLSVVLSAGAWKGETPMPVASVLVGGADLEAALMGMTNSKFWLAGPTTD